MRKLILTTTALVSLTIASAHADTLADKVVQDLTARGYTSIEVSVGPTQLMVEGYQPTAKIEMIHDLVTGAVLKEETETLDPAEINDDYTPGVEIEDVAQDFLDADGKAITDDEALNDVLANQVTNDLVTRGYTTVETLIGPNQVRASGYNATGDTIEVVYDRVTGAVIRESTSMGLPNDDDFAPGTLIEDVGFDFLDSEGNVIVPEDSDDVDVIEDDEAEDEAERDDDTDDDTSSDDDGSESEDGGEGGEGGESDGGEGDGGEE